ncbi:unnamed protein product [Arabis nemorensis]|uniref:DNA2/NAM7 helicase-like C-terminal domain-containing protein n=1 Tax=Arabis nemorensis TaxID=586526 RepID=A0A565BIZ0_9BRAS|nr:unnamed protein product [Arabis nemorensis]
MMSSSCYTFEGESLFVEREEIHEIYREIHGDPIYDVYEDDVLVIDFIFKADTFRNKICAKSRRNQICPEVMQNPSCAKIEFNQFRAGFVEDSICAKFGRFQICSEGVRNPVRAYLGFHQVCAKSGFYQKNGFEDLYGENPIEDSRTNLSWSRGPDAAQIQDSRTNLSWPARPDASSIPYSTEYPLRFGVFLMTLTTNTWIWNALHNEASNSTLIQSVLQPNALDTEQCFCYRDDVIDISACVNNIIRSTSLNSSQQEAILGCLKTRSCNHKNSVKLIWGPPGTGKTKIVATLLSALLKLKCKTVVCAPTNTAIVEVASRLLSLFKKNSSSENATYRLGGIVLSGNRDRMGITKNDHVLLDVFLDHRIGKLENLFSPFSGWSQRLESLIDFLENTEAKYNDYVDRMEEKEERYVNILTFGGFVRKCFKGLSEEVEIDMVNLYTHLPKSFISSEDVNKMIAARQALEHVRYFLQENASRYDFKKGSFKLDCFNRIISLDCLAALRLLQKIVEIPDLLEHEDRRKFCLQNAHIIFCTAFGATEMNAGRTGDIKLVVIDEAAQLKECESVATLQLPGLRHAVLIGDEYQLPAMVHNEESEKAKFGRSLFERLVLLGHNKHLIDVQYRMHLSISRFPNMEFYGGRIRDVVNVQESVYQKRFLQGNMYGSFSFINVGRGKEDFGDGHSPKNMVEVAVISEIISNLFKVSSETRMKMSVGVVSPYKGQVRAIQERVGDKYSRLSNELFTLNVRSVDGFQGGGTDSSKALFMGDWKRDDFGFEWFHLGETDK